MNRLGFVFGMVLLSMLFGCCDLTVEDGMAGVYEAITKDNSSTFTDSSGNMMILILDCEDTELMEWQGYNGSCTTADDKFEYRVATWKAFASSSQFSVRFEAVYPERITSCPSSYIGFGDEGNRMGVLLSCTYLTGFEYDRADVLLQGVNYINCWRWTKTDTLGNQLGQLIIDEEHGFLVFSKANSFHWERVPD